ncbi:DinB family protein [Marinomonas posidonica]|uniref:DinB family protein n=1 Tax=Marinomonas posidonica (strain CECT 7376 / NCIMB 14433 / IVIA-Po-181) TaxID=491952 RepID=F6CUD3_MARPP|nr:DinB family protein [Marinomonas posidonica]AEF55252.1 DinB family protein [Marinomonas posidonica IVIA-Po-181]
MISQEYCQKLAVYHSLMNQQLYSACEKLSDNERKEDNKLFFKSIHGTLNHLLFGDIAWLSRFLQKENEIPDIGQELYSDYYDLWQARKEWDQKLLDWSATVEHEWLASDFTFTSKVDQSTRTRPAWLLVSHLFNHGTHHRGQLTTILSQYDIDYGVTDIPFLIVE